MKQDTRLRRDVARPSKARSARLGLEILEGRQLLATLSGARWTYPGLITYSFIPDGTSIGGTPSNLYQSLNQAAPSATWQQQFQKAAAVWAAVANINLAQVSDNGAPVGGDGFQQGDARFGDIRIGAMPQGGGVLAYALSPPPINGGSDAGDIVMNSSIAWRVNNDFDLQTVAIHEFGHALGLGHSAITSAVMYAYYTNMKQGLTGDDIAGIQAIYGPTPGPDGSNTSAAAAIDLTPMVNPQAQVTLGNQYIASATNLEWYKVTVPANTTGTMTVVMQSSGLSSLSPRLAVYNSAMAAVGQAVQPNSYGSTATFTVGGVSPGQVYYVRASSANTGPSAVGAFALQVNLGSAALPPVPAPNTAVLAQPDQGVNLMYETVITTNSSSGSSNSGPGSNNSGKKGSDDGSHTEMVQIGDMTSWGDKLTVADLAHGAAEHGQSQAADNTPSWTGSTLLFGGLDHGTTSGQLIAAASDVDGSAGKPSTPSNSDVLLSLDGVLSQWQRRHTFGGL